MLNIVIGFFKKFYWIIKASYPLRNLEARLLKNNPVLWRTRILAVIYYSFLATVVFCPFFLFLELDVFWLPVILMVLGIMFWSSKLDRTPLSDLSRFDVIKSALIYVFGLLIIATPTVSFLSIVAQGKNEVNILNVDQTIRQLEADIGSLNYLADKLRPLKACSLAAALQEIDSGNSEEKEETLELFNQQFFTRYSVRIFAADSCKVNIVDNFISERFGKSQIESTVPAKDYMDERTEEACKTSQRKNLSDDPCILFSQVSEGEFINIENKLINIYDLKSLIREDIYEIRFDTGLVWDEYKYRIIFILALTFIVRFAMYVFSILRKKYGYYFRKSTYEEYLNSAFKKLAIPSIEKFALRNRPFLWSTRTITVMLYLALLIPALSILASFVYIDFVFFEPFWVIVVPVLLFIAPFIYAATFNIDLKSVKNNQRFFYMIIFGSTLIFLLSVLIYFAVNSESLSNLEIIAYNYDFEVSFLLVIYLIFILLMSYIIRVFGWKDFFEFAIFIVVLLAILSLLVDSVVGDSDIFSGLLFFASILAAATAWALFIKTRSWTKISAYLAMSYIFIGLILNLVLMAFLTYEYFDQYNEIISITIATVLMMVSSYLLMRYWAPPFLEIISRYAASPKA